MGNLETNIYEKSYCFNETKSQDGILKVKQELYKNIREKG